MEKGIVAKAVSRAAWALFPLVIACQEEAAQKPPEVKASPICAENPSEPLCGQAAGCRWTGAACTTQASAADTGNSQAAACASKAQTECNTNCHWDLAIGKCADGATSTSATTGTDVCAQHANNTLGCLQAQPQGCSWNSNTCVTTNPNAAACAAKTSAPDCSASAGIGCQWSNFKCVSTMVVNGNNETGTTIKPSSGSSGGNNLLVVGLGILATVLPMILNKNHQNSSPVTATPQNNDAGQVVGYALSGGGVSNVGNASLASQCAQLDETQCKANFVACTWSGKTCTGKQ